MVNVGLLLVVLFLVLVLMGAPLYISLSLPPLIYIVFVAEFPLVTASQTMVRSLDSFVLLAVPMFIYFGSLMNHSGIADRIFNFANDITAQSQGGLAQVNIITSLIFSGMSGSAMADIGGVGRILINQMKENGYSNSYASALTSASATVGPIFPPSIPLIIFGVIAQVSVVSLLIAGAIPALLTTVFLMVGTAILARRRDFPTADRTISRSTIARKFLIALPAMLAPFILIGGMLMGFFGPTEAAAVTILYMVLVNVLFYRDTSVRYLWTAAVEAAYTTSVILITIAAASLFTYVLTLEQTAEVVTTGLLSISTNPLVLLLVINVLLLIIGLFLEPISAMLIAIPLTLPPLVEVGVDPVHYGVIMVFNLMIGLLTPPLGLSIFLSSDIADVPIEQTIQDLKPYYVMLLATLLVITLVPELSLWLTGFL